MIKQFNQIILFATMTLGALPAQATLSKFELANGMQVLVKEDHRAPVAVQQVWYRVGSTYEHGGITGLSHMLEHMMFKGTKSYAAGEFSKQVSKLGGQENAFTSYDYTAYYQVVGRQHLEKVMELEADRMRHLVLKEADFQTERDVIAEERRMRTEDNPRSKLYELFRATAFINSPSHHPVIGWMSDIQNYELQDLQAWYRQWYAPNNATLVVVGDVDPQQVFQWAKRYYGKHSPEMIAPPKPQAEVPQSGQRRVELKAAVQSPSLMMGFHAPSLVTAADPQEVYALSVLASVLAGDDSARFNKHLIREQKVLAGASARYDETSRATSLFTISATPAQGKTLAQAEAALWHEIEALQAQQIEKSDLQKILAQAEAQYVFHQDSIEAQAMILGSLTSIGLPIETYDQWIERLRRVTPEQVQAVAQKYFTKDKVTVASLKPNGEIAQPKPHKSFHGGQR
ncbi:peptidase M16 [Hydrogenovibrio sp. SC-1]|uniref:M16 family metallopeptidase n=1 Tax=Hydrogenovibrio sp. SC-1 TaxID=2065820 RepID=UPI000C7E0C42|nr:pitrilysin family protein [Hydrogenovibrio sp. SC-1]PLA74228.1 peptidase M16 [Hydrogenovibrio sp. SC-1]